MSSDEKDKIQVKIKVEFGFSAEALEEIQPMKNVSRKRKRSAPEPIPISDTSSSESLCSPAKSKRRLSFVGSFLRSKPPFPKPKFVITDDGENLSLFYTKKYVFSNHFPADFTVNDIKYSCSEQYYMRYKAVYFHDEQIAAQMMQTSDPSEMKKLGRRVEGFDEDEWKKVSCQVMKIGCYNKFYQNKPLRIELFKTMDTKLVEASPKDYYWGIGLSMDSEDVRKTRKWRGRNMLGSILTALRDHLKKQPEFQEEVEECYKESNLLLD